MTTLDLFIIYLACGSPFAVYHLTSQVDVVRRERHISAILNFLLWPAFVASLIYQRLAGVNRPELSHFRIEQIRCEIERIAFTDSSTSWLFEFREIFSRYAGLFEAGQISDGEPPTTELLEISGHNETVIASRCLIRRNAKKLEFHKALARCEFTDMITATIADSRHGPEVARLAIELAGHLDDRETATELATLMDAGRDDRA